MAAQDTMRSEITVSFSLYGFPQDPDEITASVGIRPSSTTRIGDPPQVVKVDVRAKEIAWTVDSGLDLDTDVPAQIRALLTRLEPGWEPLVEFGHRFNALINCVVKSYGGDRPAIWFDKDVVRRVAEVNADLDVDLYVYD